MFAISSLMKFRQKITIVKRLKHKYFLNMNNAYLRHVGEENDQFEIGFRYVNEKLNVDRQFNFCRKLSETVASFTSRIVTNVEKKLNKKIKKSKGVEDIDHEIKVNVLLNGEEVSKESICGDIFQPGEDVILKIIDTPYKVIINSPWVETISLPSCIMAGFPVYPNKFEASFTDKSISKFVWSRSQDSNIWEVVGDQYIYFPTNEDIGHLLKLMCTPMNTKYQGPSIEIISNCKVEANPGKCPFENRHQFTKEKTEGKEFRVVSYNILADLYCDSDYTRQVLFPYCPHYALAIDYRKNLIIKEVLGYNADIICLQEVDRKVFNYDLDPTLSHLGYESNFFTKGGEVAEGLAFFCNKKRFKILESHRLVFAEHINRDPLFADIWEKISKNCQLAERILQRTTTLSVNVVESMEYDEILIVANIHLYFHPDADHIRLLHGGIAIKFLENFQQKLEKKITEKRVSLVFCGDFNSVPECGIYQLLTTGKVSKDCIDYQSNKEEAVTDVELEQGIKLESACGTPKYTNFTAGFAACLDYIYYDTNNLRVTQVVPFPSYEELTENTALPSVVVPSDHVALVSDLTWI